MWRWFVRAPTDFARIYNHVFGQELAMSKVRDQFENYLRLHGPDAFVVYRSVFGVPFNDPESVYGKVRNVINVAALELDIDIHRLVEEEPLPSGRARKAKSLKTRRLHKILVERARREATMTVQLAAVEDCHAYLPVLDRMTLNTSGKPEVEEFLTDTEDMQPPSRPAATHRPNLPETPALGFRVWDNTNSKSKFCEEQGFVSQAFSIWKGPYPQPFSSESDDGKLAISLLCNLHFSMISGGASAWISVSTSLLQALVKASSMKRPRIALIDLDHPTLKVVNKTLHAAEV
jgi:hypothetical protein